MTTQREIPMPSPTSIVLNADLSGYDSARRPTPAHVRVMKHYASPLLEGPPPSDDLLELICHIYTEDEADLVQHLLPLWPRTAAKLSRLSGRSPAEVRRVMDHLAFRKSVLFAYGEPRKYAILPIVPGTFEFAMITTDPSTRNAWHKRFAEIFTRLWDSGYLKDYDRYTKPMLRYIPVGGVAKTLHSARPSDRLEEILDRYDTFAVTNCQCRILMDLAGKGCGKPMEACVFMGSLAASGISRGLMRKTDAKEIIEIKRRAEEQGCVTWMLNTAGHPWGDASCSCCGCCCHMLRAVSEFNVPKLISEPHFIPEREAGKCNLCKICVKACPMGAWQGKEVGIEYLSGRCIGCGLCALACPEGALAMEPVPEASQPERSYVSMLVKAAPGLALSSAKVFLRRFFS